MKAMLQVRYSFLSSLCIILQATSLRLTLPVANDSTIEAGPGTNVLEIDYDTLVNTSDGQGGSNALLHEWQELGLQSIRIVKKGLQLEAKQKRRPITFIHVHKTAGSLICRLASLAGERIVSPSANCNENSEFVNDDYHSRWVAYITNPHKQVKCADRQLHMQTNGFTFSAIEREVTDSDMCPDIFIVVGFMRQPLQRLESLVNFGEHRSFGIPIAKYIDCVQQRNCDDHTPEWEHFDNYFVRSMAGKDGMIAAPGGVTEQHFEIACKKVQEAHLLAPMECLFSRADNPGTKAVHQSLHKLFGWSIEPSVRAVNSHHGRERRFTKENVESLEKINVFDLRLYQQLQATYAC